MDGIGSARRCAGIWLLALAAGSLLGASEPGERRNLVLITLDTTRADALVPYGQPRPSSPAIDRMAREGVLFEQVASASPSTLPSHATILTGQYPFQHGVRSNTGYRLTDASLTLAERLRAHGYRTAAEIAAPVLGASKGLAQGFERYHDLRAGDVERIRTRSNQPGAPEIALEERPAGDVTRFAKRFVDAHAGEPFFLWLHYFDPHRFYVRRPEIERRLPGDGYLGEVLYTDTQVGELMRHLEARGLRERTLVVLVADHGEGNGDHGESTHAYLVYESTMRVPLLLWGPTSLPAGRRVGALARTIDVVPTALDWLGLDADGALPGRSLLADPGGEPPGDPLAYGESIEFVQVFGGDPLRFVRRGRWKYIHQREPELYDLASDPGEQRNLAAAHPERVAALRRELESLLRSAPQAADASVEVSPAEREQLVALGYLAAEGGADARDLASLELRGPSPAMLLADIEQAVEAAGRLRVGQAADAERILAKLVARHPRSATLQRDHAEALLALGRRSEARKALEASLRGSEGCNAVARVTLADLLRTQGDRRAQHRVLQEGVARCGEQPELLNNLAWVLATSPVEALRDGREAEALARRALAAHGADSPEILDTLAAAQAETGDFGAAAATLRRAIGVARADGRPPEVAAMLGASLARIEAGQPIRDE